MNDAPTIVVDGLSVTLDGRKVGDVGQLVASGRMQRVEELFTSLKQKRQARQAAHADERERVPGCTSPIPTRVRPARRRRIRFAYPSRAERENAASERRAQERLRRGLTTCREPLTTFQKPVASSFERHEAITSPGVIVLGISSDDRAAQVIVL
jgi:transposase InsO family protein